MSKSTIAETHTNKPRTFRLPVKGEAVDFTSLGLNKRDLEVLSLHYYDGYSLREIGDMYGIVKQSVKNRIDKCKRIFEKAGMPSPKHLSQPKITGSTISMDPAVMDSWCEDRHAEQ